MRRKRNLQTTLNVRGKLVEAVTRQGLANALGKSLSAIKRYEKDEIFPPAPIMYNQYRYYPLSLVRKLIPIVAEFPTHKRVDPDVVVEIAKLFNEEIQKYAKED